MGNYRSSSNSQSPTAQQSSTNRLPAVHHSSAVHQSPLITHSTWHHQFEIPDLNNFSSVVKTAVETGIVTGLARREIIQVLRTYMLKYTIKPTGEQYQTVCSKLVTKYPNLRDTEGESIYVSS